MNQETTYKPIELKGGAGKESATEGIYGQIGQIKGTQQAILTSIVDIKENLTRLWNKFDASQSILHQTAKDLVEDHEESCPMKIQLDNLEQEKKDNTASFRWFVGIMLTIITIIVSVIIATGMLK